MSEKAELEESGWTAYFYSSCNELGSAQTIRGSNSLANEKCVIRSANQDLGNANDSCLVSDASSGPPDDDYSSRIKKTLCSEDINDDADSSSNSSARISSDQLQKIERKRQPRWPKQAAKSNRKSVLSHDDDNCTAESLKLQQHREVRFVLDRSDQTSFASSADNFDTD